MNCTDVNVKLRAKAIMDSLAVTTLQKYECLKSIIGGLQRVLVAFSGGVDSTLVAKVALDVLGRKNVLAAIAVSPSFGQEEERSAVEILNEIAISHVRVETNEVDDPRYAANPINRCYFCKEHVYAALTDVAKQHGFSIVVDGFNADDTNDFRPGRKAGRELGVRSPLCEAGLAKDEIRLVAQLLGLSNWDKPQMACLSSRVEYGIRITPAILSQIDRAEAALRRLGFDDLRVRHHDSFARVEVEPRLIPRALAQRDQIVEAVRAAGYADVTIDPEGLRHGSMNEGRRERG